MKKSKKSAFFCDFRSQNVYILAMEQKIELKLFRKRLNLSQDEIAEKLNCVKTTYQSWENGRREPPVDIIRKLFLLGATVKELFNIDYQEKPQHKISGNDPHFINEVAVAISKLVNNGALYIKNANGGLIRN